jgi:predicted nucleotidyltransferase
MPPHSLDPEPVHAPSARTGFPLPEEFGPVLARVRAWSGPRRLAIVLGGSFASGEACELHLATPDRRYLSDVDLYVVLPDAGSQRRARALQRAEADWRPAEFLAAIEVSFLTPADLATLPARPGTLHLKRHGRVLEGDPRILERIRDWSARDVDREERLLLLENRAFELLEAECRSVDPLRNVLRVHAMHKTVLDLALDDALEAGVWPRDARERVRCARDRAIDPLSDTPDFEWAVHWREGRTGGREMAAANLGATARALMRRWCALVAPGEARPDVLALAGRAAARAPLARRWRRSIQDRSRHAGFESLWSRVRHAPRGTPQHRLNASAIAVLAHRHGGSPDPARLERVLAALGIVSATADPTRAAEELVTRWCRTVLGRERP